MIQTAYFNSTVGDQQWKKGFLAIRWEEGEEWIEITISPQPWVQCEI